MGDVAERRLLVTGTGRCGTTWFTRALRAAGLEAHHERAFGVHRHGEGEWEVEVSWLAAPYTPVRGAYVVHLVRHPLEVIRSRAAWGTFEFDRADLEPWKHEIGRFAVGHAPAIARGRSAVERAAIHWVEWNRLVVAHEVLRLEDVGPEDVRRLARLVGVEPPVDLALPPPGANGQPGGLGPEVTWDQVAHVEGLVEMATAWGYR